MAAPNPQDVLRQVEQLANKGLPRVTLVTGPNDFFRQEAMEKLLAAVPGDADLRVVDAVEIRAAGGKGEDDDAEAEESASDGGVPSELLDLRSGGLFSKRAFLCVRRAKNWWGRHAAALVEQAEKFGKGSGILIEAPKLDRRKRAVAAFVKHWVDAGSVFDFRELYELPYDRARGPLEGELVKWVADRSRALGVPLLREAAWMVVARAGKQPAELVAELERLRDQLGADARKEPLGPEDLRGRLTIGFESNPFEFTEAVLAGKRRVAQRSLHAMFARGVRSRDGKAMDTGGLFPFTSSWLYQSLTRAYEGRTLLDQGVSLRDIPGRVGIRQYGDRFVAEVKGNDLAKLRHGLLALHHAQRMLRLQGEDPEIVLERFLASWFDGAPVPTAKDIEL